MSYAPRVRHATTKRTDGERTALVVKWLQLRNKIGSAAAARFLKVPDNQLSYWARSMGYVVPRLKGGTQINQNQP